LNWNRLVAIELEKARKMRDIRGISKTGKLESLRQELIMKVMMTMRVKRNFGAGIHFPFIDTSSPLNIVRTHIISP